MKRILCLFGKHKLKMLFEYHGFCKYGNMDGFQLIEKHICENCTGIFEFAVIGENRDGSYRQKSRCIGLNHIKEID